MTARRALPAIFARLIVAIGLLAGVVVVAAAPSGAASRWSVVPSESPAGPPVGELSSVSCSSATNCFAVGDSGSGTLIERWNGTSWSIVASPDPNGSIEPALSAVSCSSPTSCFAVGSSGVAGATFAFETLIEQWNGRKWAIVASPTPSGAGDVQLSGVSCTSPMNCFAVGDSAAISISSNSLTAETLVEHWDGSSWSIVASPNPTGTIQAALFGVSCPSAMRCFAVGDYEARATGGALMEQWDGSSWSIVASPDSVGSVAPGAKVRAIPGAVGTLGPSPGLFGVACAGESSCFAVGESFVGALVERWDGASWSVIDSPSPRGAQGVELNGVSCSSSTDCSAVGSAEVALSTGPITQLGSTAVAEHWDGATWSVVPGPSGVTLDVLSGVSCPTSTSCAAVGASTLAQHWNGTSWSLASFGSKTSESRLSQLSCPSVNSCFAVGSYEANSRDNTLVEHWNGGRWSFVPTPNPSGSFDARLNAVSCSGPADCTAVGSYLTSSSDNALIEHWNGRSWSIVASPTPKGAEVADLTGVSCPTATSCNAVGIDLSLSSATTLIEQWNGEKWSIVPGPTPSGAAFLQLLGVSCSSPTDCTAVGSYATLAGTREPGSKTLIEHWDGTKWSIAASANPTGTPLAALSSVSCSSAASCMAVGVDATSVNAPDRTLAVRWDGKSWSIVASPSPSGSTRAQLLGVSCRSSRSCYAVGAYSLSTGRTLVEHWNGGSWSIVPSPNPSGAAAPGLSGVSCPSPSTCLAVGSYSAHDGSFTLSERGS